MKKTVIIYGSSTGTCEELAGRIGARLGVDDVIGVGDLDDSVIASNDNLILGTSTWGAGEMQDDWYDGVRTLRGADLSGKTVALFGCGGAHVVGAVPVDGYTFDSSDAVVDGHFVGLALDEVNESDKTDARIDAWAAAITPSL